MDSDIPYNILYDLENDIYHLMAYSDGAHTCYISGSRFSKFLEWLKSEEYKRNVFHEFFFIELSIGYCGVLVEATRNVYIGVFITRKELWAEFLKSIIETLSKLVELRNLRQEGYPEEVAMKKAGLSGISILKVQENQDEE